MLKIPDFDVSRGSTEPKEFLLEIANQLGFSLLVAGLSKPEIARIILESSGVAWLPSYSSSGSTITKEGLIAISDSVEKICKLNPSNS